MAAHHISWISPDDYLDQEALAETKHMYYAGMVTAMAGGSRLEENQGIFRCAVKGPGFSTQPEPIRTVSPGMLKRLQAAGGSASGLDPRAVEALLALSRDVVEQIVWEVVPDLAEHASTSGVSIPGMVDEFDEITTAAG